MNAIDDATELAVPSPESTGQPQGSAPAAETPVQTEEGMQSSDRSAVEGSAAPEADASAAIERSSADEGLPPDAGAPEATPAEADLAEPARRVLRESPALPPAPAVPPRIARFTGPLETPASQPSSQFRVLQPMMALKDVELLKRPVMPEDERRLLQTWNRAMEQALREERPADAVRLAHPVLRQLPRHLATYYRLIRAAWMLRRWEEGENWGRRLLRADPSNALAWRAVAMAVEQRGERARACARWQRAFECDPYEPEIRAGVVRTSLNSSRLPQLNEACLGALLLRGYRWEQAIEHYGALTEADKRRLDFQSNLLLGLWQQERQQEACEVARRLARQQPYLLVAWVVIDEAGDENDKALARHPLSTMDPDGDYVRTAWGLSYPSRSIRLNLTDSEKALIESLMEPSSVQ